MSARDELFEGLTDGGWHPAPGEAESANAMIDDYRTEVLAEAASMLGRLADTVEARVTEHYGQASGIGPGSADMLREAGRAVLDMAGKDTSSTPGESTQPAPGFFQPGRTYTRPSHGRTVAFQVTHISTAPDGSSVTAFGWYQVQGYDTWQAYSNEDFENGWTEAAEGEVTS